MRKRTAFTLIELLIVVAIIAILAAIAVPNFLEAQVRSKVSRCKADMRSIATAIEAYSVDTSHYPFDYAEDVLFPYYLNVGITTPIAYMTNAARIKDIFSDKVQSGANNEVRQRYRYRAFSEHWMQSTSEGGLGIWNLYGPGDPGIDEALRVHGAWFIVSKGPVGYLNLPLSPTFADGANETDWLWLPYDPTNGTVSAGEIIRSQKTGDANVAGYDRYATDYFVR